MAGKKKLADLIGDVLDMSSAARRKRAREQGFGDDVWYHGTGGDIYDLDPGSYVTKSPDYAGRYAAHSDSANILPLKVSERGRIDTRTGLGKKWWDEYSYINEIEAGKSGLPDHNDEGKFTSWLIDEKGFTPSSILVDENLGDELRERGQSEALKVYDNAAIRSVNAAFDPDKRDSANLLASAAPVAGLGLGALAMGQSEDAEAGVAGRLARLGYYVSNAADGSVNLYRKTGEKVGSGYEYVDEALDAAIKDSGKAVDSGTVVHAAMRRKGDQDIPDTDYRGGHTAPVDPEYTAPLHAMNEVYPDDIYSNLAQRYYGHGDPGLDRGAFSVIKATRGKPDSSVSAYRAVPIDAPDEIYPGDWVATSEKYARQHGEGMGSYKILKGQTEAKRLRTDGNSPHEYGYTGAVVPVAGLGLGALTAGGSNKAQAGQNPMPIRDRTPQATSLEMLAPTAQEIFDQYGSQDYGTIEGAVNPKMASLANFISKYIKTPIDPLTGAPLEGVEDWARKAAYGRTGWGDRGMAALDLMP